MTPDAQTNAENMLRQMLQVHQGDTQKIKSSDWSKWLRTLWRYVMSRLLSWPNIISDGQTNGMLMCQLVVALQMYAQDVID